MFVLRSLYRDIGIGYGCALKLSSCLRYVGFWRSALVEAVGGEIEHLLITRNGLIEKILLGIGGAQN